MLQFSPNSYCDRGPKMMAVSTKVFYNVTKDDLPLSCPPPNAPLWNMHPRVYLPIEKTGTANCPYCGASYKLSEKKS